MAISLRHRVFAAACALAAGIALAIGPAADARAEFSTVPTKTAGLGGPAVYDLVVLPSGRVVLGGSFTSVGTYSRSNLGALLANGKADPDFAPTTNGPVLAVAASEDGQRIFIGGTFTEVNGQPRHNLAALDASTGQLIQSWEADTSGTTPGVQSLAVSGNRLYVGGRFMGIDGAAKQKLAVVSTDSGNLVPWSTWINGAVNELRVSPDGNTVWVGGEFTRIRGLDRPFVGGIDATTGVPNDFVAASNGSRLITLALSPDGQTLYTTNNANRTNAYTPGVSNTPHWTRVTDGNVQALVATEATLYLGGHYTSVSPPSTPRTFLAAVDLSTASITPWDPRASGSNKGVWTLVIDNGRLHVGGGFTHFNGVQQRLYARFDSAP